jgi:hypothetical protein
MTTKNKTLSVDEYIKASQQFIKQVEDLTKLVDTLLDTQESMSTAYINKLKKDKRFEDVNIGVQKAHAMLKGMAG